MAILNVNELDFEQIKTNLKTYLQGSDDFADYNFSGSALDTLLDVLAYNTHYNAILTHLLANESFLDTAIKRQSVVSLAQTLGYLPRSRRSALGIVSMTILPPAGFLGQTATITRDVKFSSSNADGSFTFVPKEEYTASLQNINGVSQFVFPEVELLEGTRLENSFIADNTSLSGPFLIPNENIDTTSIRVRVQENPSSANIDTWTQYDSILEVNSTTKAYYVTESVDGLYQIRFGDDVNGKKLTNNNVIIVDYVVTSGKVANRSTSFVCSNQITGAGETINTTVTTAAFGGVDQETVDSVKRSAPLFNSTKNRAVTAKDYEFLIKNSNAAIQSVAVWGGEDNDPPIYGKVFISLQPRENSIITLADKNLIIDNVITPKAPISVIPEFVDPEYAYLGLDVRVTYDATRTVQTAAGLEGLVRTAIDNYFVNNLNVLGRSFYITQVHDAIKSVSNSILSISISPNLQRRITPTLGINENYAFNFNAKLQPRYFKSSNFLLETATGQQVKAYLCDVPNPGVVPPLYTGQGSLYAKRASDGVQINQGYGNINYDTGKVDISGLKVIQLYSTDEVLRFNAELHDNSQNVESKILTSRTQASTGAVYAQPSSNLILTKNDTVKNADTGSKIGIDITMLPRDPEL